MLKLETDIQYLSGVGPKRAELLRKELNINTIEDLIYYFPYKYIDRSKMHRIIDIIAEQPYVQIIGEFLDFYEEGEGNKKRLIGEFYDGTGSLEIIWFKGIDYIKKRLKLDKKYVVYGKPNIFKKRVTLIHPDIEEADKFKARLKAPLQAEYGSTEKLKRYFLNSRGIAKLIENIFRQKPVIPETLPGFILKKYNLMPLDEALYTMHFPKTALELDRAKFRLKFEEFLINQLALLGQQKIRRSKTIGYVLKSGDFFKRFYEEKLPFELTNAQKRVLKEIYKDFRSGKQCNRLIQGDVGSGKTVVALMSALIAIDSGYQVCLMAPTEILAQQHFYSITKMLDGLNINVRLLTGSTKTKQRRIIDSELRSGQLNFLIGTHALIEDTVIFKNLGLAIIDEQHRFGVVQRSKLWTKNSRPPHILVMSATPIPRTLAMTLYGDLDVSIIDELPPGRKPIKTVHLTESKKSGLYKFLHSKINEGQQVYIVYPLISESERLDYKYLEEGYEIITQVFPPPKYNVVMLHGKMKPAEKQEAMETFASGKAQIMVATQVIEVGVDVPNATIMVIESAERFGLSQLHQLRGRVGRGDKQSYCILVTKDNISRDAKIRMETMVATNDGFKIAEVDMQLRGPGDIFGTQQSGIPLNFKIANLVTDQPILKQARQAAFEILEKDPFLQKQENQTLKNLVRKNYKSFLSLVG